MSELQLPPGHICGGLCEGDQHGDYTYRTTHDDLRALRDARMDLERGGWAVVKVEYKPHAMPFNRYLKEAAPERREMFRRSIKREHLRYAELAFAYLVVFKPATP